MSKKLGKGLEKPKNLSLDYKAFRRRCLMTEEEYMAEFSEHIYDVNNAQGDYYIHVDNNAPVLAVAHLDTVQHPGQVRHFYKLRMGKEGRRKTYVFNAQLDDRLGAYIILDWLPQLLGAGRYDLLLTTGEETGRSTAQFFTAPRDYNWIFQFDRRGDDTVLYGFDSTEWRATLKEFEFDIGHGSFSDISMLGRLGCKAANFGCGYYDNHSETAYAVIGETAKQVGRFVKFFNTHEHTVFPHTHIAYREYGRTTYYGGYADDDAWSEWWDGKSTQHNVSSSTSTHPSRNLWVAGDKDTDRPKEMNWMQNGSATTYMYTGKRGGSYKIFVHHSGFQAAYCATCQHPFYLEDMDTDQEGKPICFDCDVHGQPTYKEVSAAMLSEHTSDELTWLDEHGVLVRMKGGWERVGSPHIADQVIQCVLCGEAEWVDQVVDIDSSPLCRWCWESVQADIAREAPELLLPADVKLKNKSSGAIIIATGHCSECQTAIDSTSGAAYFMGLCDKCAKEQQ